MTILNGFRIGVGIMLSFGLLYCCIDIFEKTYEKVGHDD